MSTDASLRGYPTNFVGMFGREHGETPAITQVEIPMIQRDYAQGRTNKATEEVREAFLEALLDALSNADALSLDFIYGRVDAGDSAGVFRPLDGQQRLTTLFLLHWYLTSISGNLDPEAPWTRFSYATRPSARAFCERLVEEPLPQTVQVPSRWLTDQPWYQYGWQFDPTVAGMLVMIDAIAQAINSRPDFDATDAWDRLTDPDSPAISFHLLPLGDMYSDEDLYITMNSRGRPLTEFENFKAQLEQIISHLPDQASELSHKVDGVWADLMWRLDDGDRVIDDEFLRYFSFLIEICEFRAGIVDGDDRSLIQRARFLFGLSNPDAAENIDFVIRAFDTWVDAADVDDFFSEYFSNAQPGDESYDPARIRLFGRTRMEEYGDDGEGASNLLRRCLEDFGKIRGRNTRLFTLSHSLLLYAVLQHRFTGSEDFRTRLRQLRNLVTASADNIIRVDRMPALLEDCERVILHGDLEGITTMDRYAKEGEIRTRDILHDHPVLRRVLNRLEDHPVLRGNLNSFEYDADRIIPRAMAFERVFNDTDSWPLLTGALLATGDYFRRPRGWSQVLFGTGRVINRATWQILLTSGARSDLDSTREVLTALLDHLDDQEPLEAQYRRIMEDWLAQREERKHYDWRYHLVKYDSMRSGWSGRYACHRNVPGYRMAMLRKTLMNSNYRDPFLYEIWRQWREATPKADHHLIDDPWFTGYESEPRWLNFVRSGTGIRSVAEGYELRPPQDPTLAKRFDGLLETIDGIETPPERILVRIPQEPSDDGPVDSINRTDFGVEFVYHFLSRGL